MPHDDTVSAIMDRKVAAQDQVDTAHESLVGALAPILLEHIEQCDPSDSRSNQRFLMLGWVAAQINEEMGLEGRHKVDAHDLFEAAERLQSEKLVVLTSNHMQIFTGLLPTDDGFAELLAEQIELEAA
jgi:hypothetical protein